MFFWLFNPLSARVFTDFGLEGRVLYKGAWVTTLLSSLAAKGLIEYVRNKDGKESP